MLKILFSTAIFCLTQSSQISFAQTPLPKNVAQLLIKNNIAPETISLMAIPAQDGSPLLAHQSEKSVSPASTMKLLSTFIALDELGPTFQWKTQFLSEQSIQKETLKGRLFLRGGGDPNLTFDKLSAMLRELRFQGLKKIDGDIVLDRSYFYPSRPELNAPAFDENPDAYYNVIPDALLIHSNITAFSLNANNKNIDAKIMTPMYKATLNNTLTLNNRPCNEWKNSWQSPQISVDADHQISITLRGSFPKNCQVKEYLNVIDRNAYIANMIHSLWQELGGTWNGTVYDGITPSTATMLTERVSDNLADTIRIINKFSDNSMARIAFQTIGTQSPIASNFTDTNQAANAEVRSWFAKHNIKDEGLSIENGSGLSRTDRISAQQLAAILKVAYQSNWYAEFASSLPIVAVDGSMKNRLKDSNAQARARIKTGYLKNVLAIAGYVRDINNKDWIVVAIINDDQLNVSKAKPVLDGIISWIADGQ
jgi:D-alanyl-D-alanine carboxypeptidase/D-alanyl-D-alanine-endopeptidase (penicillin-binding protein 4)